MVNYSRLFFVTGLISVITTAAYLVATFLFLYWMAWLPLTAWNLSLPADYFVPIGARPIFFGFIGAYLCLFFDQDMDLSARLSCLGAVEFFTLKGGVYGLFSE